MIGPNGDRLQGLERWVSVCWSHGDKARYRAGVSGDYDLLIYDNSTAGITSLKNVKGGGRGGSWMG